MDAAVVRLTLSLIGPGVIFVFGLAFAGAWMIDRRRPYLLVLAAACLLFSLGAGTQILYRPRNGGLNALVSGAFHTAAVLTAAQALLMRSRRSLPWWICAAAFAAIMAGLWHFYYVDYSLAARIYIQNFGYGLILLAVAWRLAGLARGRPAERMLFWMLLVFALHFFPRTLLTMERFVPFDPQAFGNTAFWQMLQLSLAVLGAGLALTVLITAFSDLLHDLRRERDLDHLTGVLNRRGFESCMAAAQASRAGPFSLVLCDIDHFKLINDRHGHDAGDAVLQEFARILQATARPRDIVARLGGEEFAVFLCAADLAMAHACAERLRTALAGHGYPGHAIGRVTASFGVAQMQDSETWESLYKRADTQLFAAKAAGRNCTVSGLVFSARNPHIRAVA